MSILIHRRRLGHNFCRGCLDKISASAKGPACPLCREPFNTQSIRLIRVDLCDPLPPLSYDNFPISDETDSDLSDRARSPWNYDARIRDEARILELKVAKAASTKCTFDEVSDLHKEIQDWLLTDVRYKPNGKVSQTLALAWPPAASISCTDLPMARIAASVPLLRIGLMLTLPGLHNLHFSIRRGRAPVTPSKLSVPLPIFPLQRPLNSAELAWLNVGAVVPAEICVSAVGCRLSVGCCMNGHPQRLCASSHRHGWQSITVLNSI